MIDNTTVRPENNKYAADKTKQEYINEMYDNKTAADTAALDAEYQRNLAARQQQMDKIDPLYTAKKNDVSTTYERNRNAFNNAAAANGLNVGAGAQAALARNSEYQRDMATLNASQAEAKLAAQQGIEQLKSDYQAAVREAVANNDWSKAQALMQQMDKDDSIARNDAANLAQYGDFSGWAKIYGDETAQGMKEIWIAQNPQLALSVGVITPEDYKRITGSNPPGSTSGYTGSGGGNSYGPSEKEIQELIARSGGTLSREQAIDALNRQWLIDNNYLDLLKPDRTGNKDKTVTTNTPETAGSGGNSAYDRGNELLWGNTGYTWAK